MGKEKSIREEQARGGTRPVAGNFLIMEKKLQYSIFWVPKNKKEETKERLRP